MGMINLKRMQSQKVTEMEPVGWKELRNGITKLVNLLEAADLNYMQPQLGHGGRPQHVTAEDYTFLCVTAYKTCTAKSPPEEVYERLKEIYERLKEYIEKHVSAIILPALRCKHGELLLRELVKRWANLKVVLLGVSIIFSYVERRRRKPNHSWNRLPDLNEVGMTCLRDMVYSQVRHEAVVAMIAMIRREREGEQIDRTLMKSVVDIFLEVGSTAHADEASQLLPYQSDMEAFLLDDALQYYQRLASSWIEEDSFPAYMHKAEECWKSERERAVHYLHASSEAKLLVCVQKRLLAPQLLTQFLDKEDSGCRALFRDGKLEDLSEMYRLILMHCSNHVGAKIVDYILSIFKEHLAEVQSAILNKAAADHMSCSTSNMQPQKAAASAAAAAENPYKVAQLSFVWNLIELHDKYWQQIALGCFYQSGAFQRAVRKAFEVICNKRLFGSTTTAELLAMLCDNLQTRAGSSSSTSVTSSDGRVMTEEAMNKTVDRVAQLLAEYVNDKDVFAEAYRRKLARRLLSNKTLSSMSGTESCDYLHHERSFIANLKQHCGAPFTYKMEGMLKDLTVAKENEASFRDYRQNHAKQQLGRQNINVDNNVDFRVTVLTSIHWPGLRSFNHLTLPPEMAQCMQSFKDFYRTKPSSPKLLTWIHSLGACNVVGSFNKGAIKKVELQVTTLQAAVLLLFNETERVSCTEVKDKLNLGEGQMASRLLHSLSSSKYQILIASKAMYPNDGSLAGPEEDDHSSTFEFNAGFSSKTRRVKIPPPASRDIDQADQRISSSRKPNVLEDVETDRRYAVDACLVRIMKSRRVLGFQQLVVECVEQLRGSFKPDIKLIKKRMEDLITRDYFERDPDDPTLCKYLA